MCKNIETEYGCGHTTSTTKPCSKGKEPGNFICFSTKPKYCFPPKYDSKQLTGLCDNCRKRAADNLHGRKGRSSSRPAKGLGRSASHREPAHNEKIRLVHGSSTGRTDFLHEDGPARGRSRDASRDHHSSRGNSKAPRPVGRETVDKGKGRSSSVPSSHAARQSVINVPHDQSAVPPQRGSISTYKNKALPSLPPNSSKSSKIAQSSSSGSRSGSSNRRHSQSRDRGSDKNAPVYRESQRFQNPRAAPGVPYPVPQHSIRDDMPHIIAEDLRREKLAREQLEWEQSQRERGRRSSMNAPPFHKPVPQQPPPHQPYINFKAQQRSTTGQVSSSSSSSSSSSHYPPSSSRHVDAPEPRLRRKLSKTRVTDDNADRHTGRGRSGSSSSKRDRSASRSRHTSNEKKHHEKKHQKQPSAASSFMNKVKAGLGYGDEEYESDDSWVCSDARAIERGESAAPSRTASRRNSVYRG
ncbi:hypothetical protein B0T20DRAFT_221876 [Sordaria brevicollis]|uniref:Uncharacterized protein n=1 Tax=Sordaria brevicollis TaxID=83679 RepID=A0AAE0PCN6_SORBR|nr:hypothetical protein B0T20DRAFT_221876 [Sordaria brevicollis]